MPPFALRTRTVLRAACLLTVLWVGAPWARAEDPPEDPDALIEARKEEAQLLHDAALELLSAGRAAEARRSFERARDLFDLSEAPVEAAWLTARIAMSLEVEGRAVEAVDTMADAARRMEAAHEGREHTDVATCIYLHGVALGRAGREEESIAPLLRALAMERRLGGSPESLLPVLDNLATAYHHLGREADEFPLLEEALETRLELHEGDHPDLVQAHQTLADCFASLERWEAALPHYRAATDMLSRISPAASPRRIRAVSALADCLAQLGRHAEAIAQRREVVALEIDLHGGDHAHVAQELNQLARQLRDADRPGEALPYYERALAMNRRLYGEDHGEVSTVLGNLALCLLDLGRHADALESAARAAEGIERREGADSPLLAAALNAQAHCLVDLGRVAEALPVFQRIRRLAEAGGAASETWVPLSLNNLAECLDILGRPAEALALQRQALEIARRAHPGDDRTVAGCLDNVADLMLEIGRPEEALAGYQESVAMLRRLLEDDHTEIASGLSGLATALWRVGRHLECVEAEREAFEMRVRLLPPNHPDLASSAHNLALLAYRLGQHELGLRMVRQALDVYLQLYPDGHPRLANSMRLHAQLLEANGDFDLGGVWLQEALEMARRLQDPSTYAVAAQLGHWHLMHGAAADAIPFLEEAIAQIEALRDQSRGLTDRDRARYFERLRSVGLGAYDAIVEALVREGRALDALSYVERGRARGLLDLLRRSDYDPFARALERASAREDGARAAALGAIADQIATHELEVGHLMHAVAAVHGRSDLDVEARRRQGTELSKELSVARRQLAATLAERDQAVRAEVSLAAPATGAAVQALLAPDERMLVYTLQDVRGLLLLVPPPGQPVRAIDLVWPDGSPVTLDSAGDAVATFLDAIAADGGVVRGRLRRPGDARTPRAVIADTGRRLRRALLPAAAREALTGAQRIYLVPHGALHRLPFEALVLEEEGEAEDPGDGGLRYWLDEQPPFVYLPSGSVLGWCRRRRDEQRSLADAPTVLALGDPVFARVGDGAEAWAGPEKGALVLTVPPGSVGSEAGLEAGDVILGYDDATIADHRDLREAAHRTAADVEDGVREAGPARLRVWRIAGETILAATPGELGVRVAEVAPPEAWRRRTTGGDVRSRLRAAGDLAATALAPLPGTRREVEAIVAAYGKARTTALLGAEATETHLFRLAPRAHLLHVATHGLVDETEAMSLHAMALTLPAFASEADDGFLELRDLFEHWRDRLSGCRLVVLSACDTQRGTLQRDEGVFALPWGFFYAGSPAVVASQWSVADASTALLMGDLYRRLESGADGGTLEAFTAARRALRKTHPAPFHWAPFVYIGDPR